MDTQMNKDDIDQLNSFLRGEISAVETYSQALEAVDGGEAEATLHSNRASHQERVALLRDEIKALGGQPADGSGPWGTFAQAVQGGAKLFGNSAAVAALEQGEDHGLNDYQGDLENLSPAVRTFVAARLLPEQQASRDAAARLQAILN